MQILVISWFLVFSLKHLEHSGFVSFIKYHIRIYALFVECVLSHLELSFGKYFSSMPGTHTNSQTVTVRRVQMENPIQNLLLSNIVASLQNFGGC